MTEEDAAVLLELGEITVEGRVTVASNATLYCSVALDGVAAACVYKPTSGERPLWDYPDGTLAGREYASYLTSVASGWQIVPPTVLRDGPLGQGMVQLWVAEDDTFDIVAGINSGELDQLRRIALFDAVINNSDRKVSHLLPVRRPQDSLHIHGIDHGVSFGVDGRLRTVLWQWAGVRIADEDADFLDRLAVELDGELGTELAGLLTTAELRAVRRRVRGLRTSRLFPLPPSDWPAVPYPLY
jgi:hypothetical protein